ncbi:unnamed protein product [Rotaria socialis]|uniref:Uncharacterized protein n=1 Tax=Rotaria socialis TaxID=392032 RepID=A0A818FNK8_9BILA|nr:unnamed protein product [Rotaria socialis]CAF3478557.1 unnamed protein product [Rotaria socialis]
MDSTVGDPERVRTYSRIAAVFGRFLLMIRPFTAVSSRRNARPGKSVCVYLPSSINLQYLSLNIQYFIFVFSDAKCVHIDQQQ